MMDKKDKVLWTVSIGLCCLPLLLLLSLIRREMLCYRLSRQRLRHWSNKRKKRVINELLRLNTVTKNSFGLDTSRVATDDRIATEIIKTATTWSDADSYNAARTKLRDDYKFTDDSQMLSTFMPEVKDAPLGQDGKMINTINAYGLNMTYVKMHSYVVGVDNGVYSYFTVVDVLSKDVQGHIRKKVI